MNSKCELCERDEPSILGATQRQIAIGERCYSKLIEKLARWGPDSTKAELLQMLHARVPLQLSISSPETPPEPQIPEG